MNLSEVSLKLNTVDANNMLQSFLKENQFIQIQTINPQGVFGRIEVKVPLLNTTIGLDFIGNFSCEDQVLVIDITIHKFFPIPNQLVTLALKEITKNSPFDVDVLQQSLRIHTPSILPLIGFSFKLKDVQTFDDYLSLVVEDLTFPPVKTPVE